MPFAKDSRELKVRVEGPLVFNTITLMIDMALSGLGLAYLPEDQVRENLRKGRLVQVLADWCPKATCRARRTAARAARTGLDNAPRSGARARPARPQGSAGFEIGSREGASKAVEQGLGVSVVADFEFAAHPNQRALEINDVEIRTEYRIVCLRERVGSPKIAAFMKVAGTLRL